MDDDNVEVVEVLMDDNNVEIVEVFMDGDEHVQMAPDDDDYVDVFDVSPLYVVEEVEQIARAPFIDRPAGVQHPLPEQHNIGPLRAVCRDCTARHFQCERTTSRHFSTCCSNGLMTVSGPRVLTTAPHVLQRLLVEDTAEGRHYRTNIRRYNNTLAFAAFHSDLNTRRLPGRGPSVYQIHGQAYRTISNDLLGNEPMQRRYCQLYFVESGEANRIRMEQQQLQPDTHRLLPSVLAVLDGLLRDINPYAQSFE